MWRGRTCYDVRYTKLPRVQVVSRATDKIEPRNHRQRDSALKQAMHETTSPGGGQTRHDTNWYKTQSATQIPPFLRPATPGVREAEASPPRPTASRSAAAWPMAPPEPGPTRLSVQAANCKVHAADDVGVDLGVEPLASPIEELVEAGELLRRAGAAALGEGVVVSAS